MNALSYIVSGSLSNGFGLYCINGLVPGTGSHQRVGRKTKFVSIYIRGSTFQSIVAPTPTTAFTSLGCRMIVFVDKQSNNAAPNLVDLLQTTNTLGSTALTWTSPVNLSNAARFHILLDKQFPVQTTGPTYLQGNQTEHKIYKRLSVNTNFNTGVVGDYTDITSGSIWIALLSEGLIASQNACVFTGTIRLRFVD
jgi:hypothetical protein